MNLKQRYRSKGSRRLVRFLGFYLILAFFLLFYSTFARYTTVVENDTKVGIANWQISLNDTDIINGETLTDTVQLVPLTQTTTNNKLAPGQNGYFDITINPEGTEVAIEYTINLDISSLPTGIILTTYEIIEDNISGNIADSQIHGEINLQQMQQLTVEEKKTIRIYWEWNESSTKIPTGNENYKIETEITVKQKIS